MKKWMFLLGIIVCWIVIFLIQPTKIALIYPKITENRQKILIVLENLPVTSSARMDWWENNKDKILGSLNEPLDMKRTWSVTVYELGKGFKMFDPEEQELDSYCFDNLPTKLNCIRKEGLFGINYRDGKILE